MAWWIYLGQVTTPIAGGVTATLDERGPKPVIVPRDGNASTVLVPRLKFEAPMSSVSHLIRLKKVVALKPHQIPKPESPPQQKTKEEEVPAAPKVSAGEPKSVEPNEVVSDRASTVVASSPAEDEEAPQDANDDDDEEEKVKQEKKEKKRKTRAGPRRG